MNRTDFLFRIINLWPPYFAAGIRVLHRSSDAHTVVVQMKLGFFNKNLVGTHFGGSLYAMCDPFYMWLLMKHLGRDYLVWDKAASIQFLKPGRGTVEARFHIPAERIEEIRREAQTQRKVEPVFQAGIISLDSGEVVARVEKRLYVRRKDRQGDPGGS